MRVEAGHWPGRSHQQFMSKGLDVTANRVPEQFELTQSTSPKQFQAVRSLDLHQVRLIPHRLAQPPQRLLRHNVFRLSMELAAESCEVVKRLETWKEEIGATFYGRESGQSLNLSSDWPLRNSYVVGAILSADYRIALVA
jgi:hypothetical protein